MGNVWWVSLVITIGDLTFQVVDHPQVPMRIRSGKLLSHIQYFSATEPNRQRPVEETTYNRITRRLLEKIRKAKFEKNREKRNDRINFYSIMYG